MLNKLGCKSQDWLKASRQNYQLIYLSVYYTSNNTNNADNIYIETNECLLVHI